MFIDAELKELRAKSAKNRRDSQRKRKAAMTSEELKAYNLQRKIKEGAQRKKREASMTSEELIIKRKMRAKQLSVRQKQRCLEDPSYKIAKNLRTRLRNAIKNNQKVGSAIDDLGCTVKELKKHLESKWQEGMSWDNYGYYGWHIDHIKPLVSFDLTNEREFKIANYYTNLQPLWAQENFTKGAK